MTSSHGQKITRLGGLGFPNWGQYIGKFGGSRFYGKQANKTQTSIKKVELQRLVQKYK